MEHHVLGWTGSPSEDHPSVSNVSTQSLVGLLMYRMNHGHNIHLDTSQDYQPNPMADHHRMHPLQVHAQPPGLYDRPWQPSAYMTAFLGIHMHLTHGQTVSGPIASAGFMVAHH